MSELTSRERVIRTLKHQSVDRAPRELWSLPGIGLDKSDELKEMLTRFPNDFTGPFASYGQSLRAKGTAGVVGSYTDAWGCVWHVAERGVAGEVKEPPLADWSALASYELPWELLKGADFSKVSEWYAKSHEFVKAGTETRMFERLQFLRGSEALFADLAYGSKELFKLIDMLHDFFCKEMELWAACEVDGVTFMDDWGAQRSLLISPTMWRKIFKPLYREYCDILHKGGKFVFFHSDGFIEAIIPDLIEIGVDALNSQLFCMDIEEIGCRYNGEITFWGEIDRQHILPRGSEDDVREAVRRVRRAMDEGKGGVIAECEWGMDTPTANVAAVYDEWTK